MIFQMICQDVLRIVQFRGRSCLNIRPLQEFHAEKFMNARLGLRRGLLNEEPLWSLIRETLAYRFRQLEEALKF